MTTTARVLGGIVVCLLVLVEIRCYVVPEATLIAFKPKGFQVSIPDSEGMQIFAFHGNVNREIVNREAGEMSVDILRSKNGRWVYENPRIRLKVGDVINYWLYVQADGLGYPKDDLTWRVTALVDKSTPGPAPGPGPGPVPVTPEPTPVTCQQSVTTVNGIHKCQNQLIFEETFDSLQRPKWENVVQFGGDPGYPFVLYTNKAENCFVSDGFLQIKPTLQPEDTVTSGTENLNGCTGQQNSGECNLQAGGGFYIPPVLTAQLRSKSSFNFRYGKVEIRAKMPLGDWIFSEIQLKPKDGSYGSNPKLSSGQINLALVKGNRNLISNGQQIGASCLESNCEMALNNAYHREECNETRPALWGGGFHTYGLVWTPDYIAFSVNGNEIGRVVPPDNGFQSMAPFNQFSTIPWSSGTKLAPFDKEFYISLGLGVGGFVEFPDNSVTVLRQNSPQQSANNVNHAKPWLNGEAKAIAKFWNDKNKWYPTWNADSVLQVDYVRVWAL